MGKRVISAVLKLQDDFSKNLKKPIKQMNHLEQTMWKADRKIKNFKKSAVESFKSIGKAGAALGGVAIAGLGTSVAAQVVEMDSAFSKLEAKTGLTGAKLNELKGVASEVFKQGFGESVTTVTDDIARLQSMFRDLNNNEINNLATGAYTVSKLWGSEVSEVGKTIKGMTANFKDLSENKALDLMTFAFQKTGDHSNDLLDTFNEYSMHFSKLGLSAEEFTGILISGAENGAFNMDKVGDAVKELGIRVIDGSKTTAEGFKAIGFNAADMADKFAQGGDTANNAFQATIAGLAALQDPVKRNAAGVNLFGTQWEDVRDDVVLAMADGAKAIEGFDGATEKASKAMHDNFGSKMISTWRNLKVGIADAFKDNGGTELMDSIASAAQKAVPKIQNMIKKGIEFGQLIKDNWGTIKPVLETAGIAVSAFVVAVGTMKVIQGVSALITGFRTAMAAATAGQWLMNGAMLASPITWLAVGIAALAVVVIKNWDWIKEKSLALWEGVKTVCSGIKQGFTDAFDGAKRAAAVAVNFMIDKVNGVIGLINKIPGVDIKKVETVDWGSSKNKVEGSFASGTNRVQKDMIAQIHKDEMIIPARQASTLRAQGTTINNVTNSKSNSAAPNVILNVYAKGANAKELAAELVPNLKMALANM